MLAELCYGLGAFPELVGHLQNLVLCAFTTLLRVDLVTFCHGGIFSEMGSGTCIFENFTPFCDNPRAISGLNEPPY